MKKVLTLVLALALTLGCALGASAEEETYTIGICQLVQHDALDAATQGFMDAVTEAMGDRVTFDVQNASGDSNTCATIVNSFVSQGVDLIMANATAAVQAAATATYDIPILGTSVTEYGVALDIPDFDGVTGYNVSGTSDLAPLDEQAAMLMELFPNAQTVGMLYCSAEPNSVYQVQMCIRDRWWGTPRPRAQKLELKRTREAPRFPCFRLSPRRAGQARSPASPPRRQAGQYIHRAYTYRNDTNSPRPYYFFCQCLPSTALRSGELRIEGQKPSPPSPPAPSWNAPAIRPALQRD